MKTVILERRKSGGPLSWHLTESQIHEIKDEDFPEKPAETQPADLAVDAPAREDTPGLKERWAWLNQFLDGAFDAQQN